VHGVIGGRLRILELRSPTASDAVPAESEQVQNTTKEGHGNTIENRIHDRARQFGMKEEEKEKASRDVGVRDDCGCTCELCTASK
jgi:hypothetical protein